MRRKVLIVFLMMLYIAPLVFISSYGSPAIPAEQNTQKEFALSEDWYNSSYHYRQKITIEGGAVATATYYQIMVEVTYDSDMQADFDDVIFTDENHVTLLDCWLESKNDTVAVFWVEVEEAIDKGLVYDGTYTYINMYYGNSEVSTVSNGTDTFLFFDDFEKNNLNRWDSVEADWEVVSDEKKNGDYSAYVDSGGAGRTIMSELYELADYGIMIHSYLRFQSNAGNEYPITSYENDTTLVYALYSPTDDWATYDGVDVKLYEASTQAAATWYEFEIGYDWVGEEFYPYVDGALKTKRDMDSSDASTVVTDTKKVGSAASSVSNRDHWLDDYYVRKWVVDEPTISGFGEEETNIVPAWEVISSVEIVFYVGVFTGALDALLILAGLIMIPASTLYLAHSAKNKPSTDKLFYGLIAFAIGWGLVLGGIG